MAKKKETEPQYLMSATNKLVMNYRVYQMSKGEKLLYSLLAGVVGGIVGFVFYGNLFLENGLPSDITPVSNVVVFVLIGYLAIRMFLPMRTKQLKEKRKTALKLQFRDMLESLSTSLASGSNVMDSFASALNDLKMQFGEEAHIVKELEEILTGMSNNIAVETLLKDFGIRSENEDILSFAEVFEVCYQKGGNLKLVVARTHSIISEKMTIEDEIQTKLTANKSQQQIMNVMPIAIVAMLRFTNDSFARNFASITGFVAITFSVAIFIGAYRMGEKIVDIKG